MQPRLARLLHSRERTAARVAITIQAPPAPDYFATWH